jgi:ribosomal protein S8
MKEKEEDLNNIINKIEVSKKLINENNSNKTEKENLILKIEEYLKSESIIYYIKKESEEDERIVINLKFGGLSQSIIKLINNINNISNKIYLNNIELSRIDEKSIECKVRITMYTS